MAPAPSPRIAALALSGFLLTGCAVLFPTRDPFTEGGTATTIRVDVENRNFYDATIYATTAGGSERRVGDVGGNGRRSFEMLLEATADVRFRIELLANGWCTLYPVILSPGDALGLEIVPDFPGTANCESRGGGTPGE